MTLAPLTVRAQQQGLDDRINEAFTPVANWCGSVVLHNFPGTSIPTIIILLVGGALFFTLYFCLSINKNDTKAVLRYIGWSFVNIILI